MIGLSLEDLLASTCAFASRVDFDKVPAILAALRRGYANVLVTDAATARGVLRADGGVELDRRRTINRSSESGSESHGNLSRS